MDVRITIWLEDTSIMIITLLAVMTFEQDAVEILGPGIQTLRGTRRT